MVCTLACAGMLASATPRAHGEEPYQRFLQQLRDEQLFDLALVYLSDLEDRPNVSREFKSDMQLERGMLLYQSAAKLSAGNVDRPQRLDEAEAALREFLETKKNHPRRSEARLKLGELLLTRAEEAKSRVGADGREDIPQAIKFYDDAHQLFESTIQELASILENIKGARIDPADTAKVAVRQQIQQDLRQAQLLSAKSVEERGRCRADDSPQRQADLEQALQMFSDLYAKEQRMVGIRNYALFYRSAIQATLEKVDDAIDGFQRIADLEGVDILRPLQTDSVAELVHLLAEQGKYPLAVDRADKWIAALRPDERKTPETLALKLELAKQKIGWARKLEKKDPSDRVASRLIRDTRNDLRGILRIPGAHLEAARELLVELGMETTEEASQELPKVKDFAEALAAAQERIDRSETDSIGLESLKIELSDEQTTDERRQELKQELQTAQQSIDTQQQQALALLRESLRLYTSQDDRGLLFDARFRLAFLLLKQQRPWDALVVGEFLARTNAGTEQGLRAAAITLGSFSDLLRTATAEGKQQLTEQLQPFAEYLVQTWPQSAEASAAASALVQLALMNKEWDKAEQFLKLVPATGDSGDRLRREVGISFYAKYLEEKKAAGEDTQATTELRTKAIATLKLGIQGLSASDMDANAVDAINALVRLLLIDNQVDEAAKIMLDGNSSPIKAIEQKPDMVPSLVAMETFRTAIQLINSRLAEGKLETEAAVTQMRGYIKRLQETATADASGSQALASIFIALARDLKEQLVATKEDAKRKQMSEALVILAVEAARSESFNTQYWAADTIVSVAEELATSAAGKAQATQAYTQAAKLLEAILAKDKSQPGWIEPAGFVTQIRLKLAQVKRGQGEYGAAIEELATILEQNNGLLDVQMEAARTYQAWGNAVNAGFHEVAIIGGRPDPKTRQKLIWGWGKIQKMTANQPNFSEQFYEARYQLAYSRWQYANSLQNAKQKSEELARAENDITSTATLYPTLGGAAMKRKFDTLLKSIQKAMGKPTVGLAKVGN
jgi:tetratricopeptide (TPR) repeat protein